MWLIGLTGGIGSGKSSVARWFRERGVPVLDADMSVRKLLNKDAETIALIRREFGLETITPDGTVNRPVLGRIVFADESKRLRLEGIIHPRIEKLRLEELERLEKAGEAVCVWDIPLLFEKGLQALVQETMLVWVPLETQIARVNTRDGLDAELIMARVQAQMPLTEKVQLADVVIDNSRSWAETEQQLETYWAGLLKRNVRHDPSIE
ncbi:MAG: dephospho-CoA kinase [Desulfitobacteriaceae bacterium]|nr:dephospho-CoA kinase [Desulfitobacteriaceae bacterium]MDI6879486.1 dephospho-CoA kinase [Desulfitobacteriaceae bacterium]MDI6915276.1 dephospho-CoA kinase [Desulfitobacteriaceae bacterium]